MDYLRKYLSTPDQGQRPSGADTVERLCNRVTSSTLLDDRRDAVRALKSLSRKFRLEVGTQGMAILINVLQLDRNDTEITGYALDTLANIMSNEPSEDEDEMQLNLPEDIGSQFTEMFIKDPENVSLLLSLLEEYDFHVRWPTVKLLTVLLTNKSREMQECILVSPMGVSKLMDLLSDSREIIRNDGLLLLIQLTKNNANIQKIVAFESAFERSLDIIREEGNSDGGIVVEDCLLLIINLLKNNSSNQIFFKEGGFVQRLTPFFTLQPADQNPQGGWSAQKVTNIHLMLQAVRTLVSPSSPAQQTQSCQKSMYQCGLLQELCSILMATGVPADVLTETINTVSEVIRGNPGNQEYFASVMAPSNPPRPAIVVLLMSMVNEKQPFPLRCAVLYCFQSFLYKNELGQSQIVQTLLPTSADANTISAGQLLCGGLFSTDTLSTWFAAVALLHSIVDNTTQKEQLLRVQLATSLGNPPVSLLQQCTNILAQGAKLQTRVGLLMLLCNWVAHSTVGVTHLLHHANNVPFLISQISASEGDEHELLVQGLCAFLLGICVHFNNDQEPNYTKQALRQIIEKRIGIENFNDKLSQVTKHEGYSKAAKKPQLNLKSQNEVLFDHAFTRLFKSLENDILKSVLEVQENGEVQSANVEEHDKVVMQYKEVIRSQDEELGSIRQELLELKNKYSAAEKQLEEFQQTVQQLKDQNALLKVGRGQGQDNNGAELLKLKQEVEAHQKDLEEKNTAIEKLKNDLTIAEAKTLVAVSSEENGEPVPGEAAILQATVNRVTQELEEMKVSIANKDQDILQYKNKFEESERQIGELKQIPPQTATTVDDSRVAELQARLQGLEGDNKTVTNEKNTLQERLKKSNEDNLKLEDQIKKLEEENRRILEEKSEAEEETKSLKTEQDDLLVLLADQDTKLDTYKTKLKELGVQVESDDEDLGDDDLDDISGDENELDS
ncbi:unnamed protein product [Owenia fusiformis]|uniref:General vesicular transport factor p115 n=1 Tax=Owenia fusiformis TaxID=6347 RepID=A0A8S4PID7_OWEFU|nr:unnamed protein product [Owenia fusiformis]